MLSLSEFCYVPLTLSGPVCCGVFILRQKDPNYRIEIQHFFYESDV